MRPDTWNVVHVMADADAWIASRLAMLTSRQSTHAASHNGKFWQGLATHAAPVVHTTFLEGTRVADSLDAHPSDQSETWNDVIPEWAGVKVPCRVIVDVYDGPSGKGWCVTLSVKHNGDTWNRTVNVGPETYRERAWAKIVLET